MRFLHEARVKIWSQITIKFEIKKEESLLSEVAFGQQARQAGKREERERDSFSICV